MRRLPTVETTRFHCPCCGYHQKGYFAVCPTPGCNDMRIRELVRQAERRVSNQHRERKGGERQ